MASLKEVKNRITSVQSTQQITKAMKMVAAAKLKKAQDRISQTRPYASKLSEILQNVSSSSEIDSSYVEQREPSKVLIIPVSSDRGLCGAFNSNVIKETERHIKENHGYSLKNRDLYVMPIGKRVMEYFGRRDYQTVDKFSTLLVDLNFDSAKEAMEHIMEAFDLGDYDRVEVVFNEFKNVATQVLKVEQLLPLVPASPDDSEGTDSIEYIYEPSKEFIVSELIPKSIKLQFFKALLESNASEQGARMMAMDKATENAGELLKELRLTYNRTRQAAITTEILEIVGGAEALSSSN